MSDVFIKLGGYRESSRTRPVAQMFDGGAGQAVVARIALG